MGLEIEFKSDYFDIIVPKNGVMKGVAKESVAVAEFWY